MLVAAGSGKTLQAKGDLCCDASLYTLDVLPTVAEKLSSEITGDTTILSTECYVDNVKVSARTLKIVTIVKMVNGAPKVHLTAKASNHPQAVTKFGDTDVEVRYKDEVIARTVANFKPSDNLLLAESFTFVNGTNNQALNGDVSVAVTYRVGGQEKVEYVDSGDLVLPKGVWTSADDGLVTALVKYEGFRDKTINFFKCGNMKRDSRVLKVALDPKAKAGENFDHRFILTWGKTPRDPDIHILRSDGKHVCHSCQSDDGMRLDVDVRNGFGPETMTVASKKGYEYIVYVYNFSNDVPFTKSSCVVGHSNLSTQEDISYEVPKEIGADGMRYWWICKIYDDGEVVDLQQLEAKEPQVANGKISV